MAEPPAPSHATALQGNTKDELNEETELIKYVWRRLQGRG